MRQFILYFGFFFIISLSNTLRAQVLWEEHFIIPQKGIWADSAGVVFSDLSEVEWDIETGECTFFDENDYAKTVSTSGGRFEVLDSDGEVKWFSPVLAIDGYDVVNVSLKTLETGSSENSEKKYVKAFYILDNKKPRPFSPDSTSSGNWGEKLLKQERLKGETLQVMVCLNSSYANDKVIIDDVLVEGIDSTLLNPARIKIIEAPGFAFTGEIFQIKATVMNFGNEPVNNPEISLLMEGEGFTITGETFSEGIYNWDLLCSDLGKIVFIITSEIVDVEDAFGIVAVYDPSERIVWENFENQLFENWETGGQWEIDSTWAIAGNFSARHLEQTESGVSVLNFSRFENKIITGKSELLFSFKVRNGNWNPSSSNYFFFSLGDEQFNRGLAIGVNAMGSSDRVSAWEIEGGEVIGLLAETNFTWDENTSAQIDLAVKPAGNCKLMVTDMESDASQETFFNVGQSLKIQSVEMLFGFSKTRSGQLWFDDLLVVESNTPPVISEVKALAEGVIKATFNEPVRGESLQPANFILSGENEKEYAIGKVEVAGPASVLIYTDEIESFELELTVINVEDMEGSVNPLSTFSFLHLLPVEPYDVVFTEIMADPSPPVGLPETEYLEILNHSEKYINLEAWELTVKEAAFLLPAVLLQPGEYLVICSLSDTALFSNQGKVCSLPRFPSLLNSGTYLKLTSPDSIIVDELTYSDRWYADTEKDDGGWSLEKIDPARNCGNQGNWIVSVDPSGGTPGRKNSVFAENPDLIAPLLEAVEVSGINEIELRFSEPLDSMSLLQPGNINIEGLGIVSVSFGNNGLSALLFVNGEIEVNREYEVEILDLADECGNISTEQNGSFSLIVLQAGDVAINEILFNPFADGSDFVELYNNSGLTIDLSKLYLATRNDTFGLKSVYVLSDESAPFYDQTLLAFTADSENITAMYPVLHPENIVQVERLPAYYNDEGRVVLLDDSLTVLDEFAYSETMHSVWLSDYDGVSLERVSVEVATNSDGSWHSASSLCGWATPGYENSQLEITEKTPLNVVLEPDAISPNNDGYNDELVITFQLDQADYLANVYIFDASGREMNRLLNNQLPGNGSTVVFDGRNVNGELLKPGIYVLFTELYHHSGKKKTFKHAFLVTDRL